MSAALLVEASVPSTSDALRTANSAGSGTSAVPRLVIKAGEALARSPSAAFGDAVAAIGVCSRLRVGGGCRVMRWRKQENAPAAPAATTASRLAPVTADRAAAAAAAPACDPHAPPNVLSYEQ